MLDHIKLYNNLMNLCKDPIHEEAFYYQDYTFDDKIYRIFNYRLVNWTTFQDAVDAKKCRGTMFEISNEPVLASLPPDKFFNYAEGDVDHSNFSGNILVHEKLDGSLISTYMHNGELRLKSKGSINSSQAIEAMLWLELPKNSTLKQNMLDIMAVNACTINLEWTGPQNRIVVGYESTELRVLSINMHDTGYTILNWKDSDLPFTAQINLDEYCADLEENNLQSIVNKMYNETTGEGYVVSFLYDNNLQYQVKVKNHTYCNLHKIKDSISNPEALAELIIRGGVDDVYDLFSDDMITINIIEDMENVVVPIFNHMVATVEAFYFGNKDLTRKEYAIKARTEVPILMPLLMNLYIEREISYEDFAVRNIHTIFGIKNVNKQYK
jgi:T4 RnlA family RNA ligase